MSSVVPNRPSSDHRALQVPVERVVGGEPDAREHLLAVRGDGAGGAPGDAFASAAVIGAGLVPRRAEGRVEGLDRDERLGEPVAHGLERADRDGRTARARARAAREIEHRAARAGDLVATACRPNGDGRSHSGGPRFVTSCRVHRVQTPRGGTVRRRGVGIDAVTGGERPPSGALRADDHEGGRSPRRTRRAPRSALVTRGAGETVARHAVVFDSPGGPTTRTGGAPRRGRRAARHRARRHHVVERRGRAVGEPSAVKTIAMASPARRRACRANRDR